MLGGRRWWGAPGRADLIPNWRSASTGKPEVGSFVGSPSQTAMLFTCQCAPAGGGTWGAAWRVGRSGDPPQTFWGRRRGRGRTSSFRPLRRRPPQLETPELTPGAQPGEWRCWHPRALPGQRFCHELSEVTKHPGSRLCQGGQGPRGPRDRMAGRLPARDRVWALAAEACLGLRIGLGRDLRSGRLWLRICAAARTGRGSGQDRGAGRARRGWERSAGSSEPGLVQRGRLQGEG